MRHNETKSFKETDIFGHNPGSGESHAQAARNTYFLYNTLHTLQVQVYGQLIVATVHNIGDIRCNEEMQQFLPNSRHFTSVQDTTTYDQGGMMPRCNDQLRRSNNRTLVSRWA
jgi:hypothetical protein